MFQLQNGFQNQSSQGFQTFISGKGQKRGRRVRDPVTSTSSSSPIFNSSSSSSSNSSFNISSNPGTDQTPARSYIHHEQPDQTDTGYNKRIRISDDIYDSLQEFGKRHQTKKLFRNIATLASEQRRTCEAKTTWKDSDRISPI